MSQSDAKTFLKNSTVNVIGGVAAAAYNFTIPAVIVRLLSTADYSFWVLGLQYASILTIFAFGLQQVLSVALIREFTAKNSVNISALIFSSVIMLIAGAFFAAILTFLINRYYYVLFPMAARMDPRKLASAMILFYIFGISKIAINFSNAIFFANLKNIYAVSFDVAWRFLFLGALLSLAGIPLSVNELALILAVSAAITTAVSVVFAQRFLPRYHNFNLASLQSNLNNLIFNCASLSVWNISMLLVSGLDVFLVNRFDASYTGTYSLAAVLPNLVAGALATALAPLAVIVSKQSLDKTRSMQLPNLLIGVTQIIVLIFTFILIGSIFLGKQFINLWLGSGVDLSMLWLIYLILIVAIAIRMVLLPYSIMLLGVGLQHKALVSAALEGITNIIASIYLGMEYGAIGVAIGTVIGGLVGVISALVLNFRNTKILTPSSLQFLFYGMVPFVGIKFIRRIAL